MILCVLIEHFVFMAKVDNRIGYTSAFEITPNLTNICIVFGKSIFFDSIGFSDSGVDRWQHRRIARNDFHSLNKRNALDFYEVVKSCFSTYMPRKPMPFAV